MRRATTHTLAAALLVGALTACSGAAVDLPEFDLIDQAPAATVDAVVFLVGDAGAAVEGQSPLIEYLREDVEQWSRGLGRDSAVSVMYLGDIIYPNGLRQPDHPDFAQDSARLWAQIGVVSGPEAQAHQSFAWFLPGNHDWGQMGGERGIESIRRLGEALDDARQDGYNVVLVPPAGSPGPVIRDLRQSLRIVALDTHWFLQQRAERAKEEFFLRITEALTEAGDREVIFTAHHPFRSAGPHGAMIATTQFLGLRYLLKKAGVLIQDLNSPVFQEFRERLQQAFEAAGQTPLVFAGGHDHSLQVLTGQSSREPDYSLISGSASKVSAVEQVPGIAYAASRPGYMLLVIRRDNVVELYVKAGDPARLECSQADETEQALCMEEGIAAFEVVYSRFILGTNSNGGEDSG